MWKSYVSLPQYVYGPHLKFTRSSPQERQGGTPIRPALGNSGKTQKPTETIASQGQGIKVWLQKVSYVSIGP